MEISFYDLIVMLLWPLVLSAAAYFIASNALAERDEISEVVEVLTLPNSAGEIERHGSVSLRRRKVNAVVRSGRGWLRVHLRRSRRSGLYASRAKERERIGAHSLDDDRRGYGVGVAGFLRDRKLSEYASP